MVEKHGIDALAERYDILRARAEAMQKVITELLTYRAGALRKNAPGHWTPGIESRLVQAVENYLADFPAQKDQQQ